MSEPFRFALTEEEKVYLKDLVRLSIASRLKPGDGPAEPSAPLSEPLRTQHGVFVTLELRGRLRGCIGNRIGTGPLYSTIWSMAQAAAFEDPRFPPLTIQEFADVKVEISILSPITPCLNVDEIEIGRHGLIVRRDFNFGLLLPQVAAKLSWDRIQFLEQTCRKAGLPPDAWYRPGTSLLWFEAEVC